MKVTLEELQERLENLEEQAKFFILPAIADCLDGACFGNRSYLGGVNPLRLWLSRKLTEAGLSEDVKTFLTEQLRQDFGTFKPLAK